MNRIKKKKKNCTNLDSILDMGHDAMTTGFLGLSGITFASWAEGIEESRSPRRRRRLYSVVDGTPGLSAQSMNGTRMEFRWSLCAAAIIAGMSMMVMMVMMGAASAGAAAAWLQPVRHATVAESEEFSFRGSRLRRFTPRGGADRSARRRRREPAPPAPPSP